MPNCGKETGPERNFYARCRAPVGNVGSVARAGPFVRFVVLVVDALVAIVLYFVAIAVFGSISSHLGVMLGALLSTAYFVWSLMLLRQRLTPDKKMLGLQAVHTQTGEVPGLGKTSVRDIPGRFDAKARTEHCIGGSRALRQHRAESERCSLNPW